MTELPEPDLDFWGKVGFFGLMGAAAGVLVKTFFVRDLSFEDAFWGGLMVGLAAGGIISAVESS